MSSLVVVAEGANPQDGQQVLHRTEEGEYRFGGIGDVVAQELAARTGKETRCCVLGHLQRGGAPTTLDRILGTRFGVKAVQLINEGHFGSMVSYQNYQVQHVPIADAVNRLRLGAAVEPDGANGPRRGDFVRRLGPRNERRYFVDGQLIQTPNDKVCCLQFFWRVRGRDSHHLHAGGMRSFDADMGIFENNAAVRGHSEALGRLRKNLRVRFSVRHILR